MFFEVHGRCAPNGRDLVLRHVVAPCLRKNIYVWHWHEQKELCQLCPAKNHATRQETCIVMMFDPICSGFTSISCKTYYIYICELSKMIPKETISYRKPGIIFSNEARRWKTCVPVWKRCGETAPGGGEAGLRICGLLNHQESMVRLGMVILRVYPQNYTLKSYPIIFSG